VEIPCFRTLASLRGSLEQIEEKIKELPDPSGGRTLWLEVEVATDDWLTDLGNRIQAMVEDKPIELLRIRRKRKAFSGLTTGSKEKLEELKPDEVFLRRLGLEEMDDSEKARLSDLFKEILARVEDGELP
ncbi:MAG: exonuclease subunit SbcD, partial [Desulfobacteraceae bacterium]|nr:exonuclease subunit SbcD [Desulfobacteraceae bacterium]